MVKLSSSFLLFVGVSILSIGGADASQMLLDLLFRPDNNTIRAFQNVLRTPITGIFKGGGPWAMFVRFNELKQAVSQNNASASDLPNRPGLLSSLGIGGLLGGLGGGFGGGQPSPSATTTESSEPSSTEGSTFESNVRFGVDDGNDDDNKKDTLQASIDVKSSGIPIINRGTDETETNAVTDSKVGVITETSTLSASDKSDQQDEDLDSSLIDNVFQMSDKDESTNENDKASSSDSISLIDDTTPSVTTGGYQYNKVGSTDFNIGLEARTIRSTDGEENVDLDKLIISLSGKEFGTSANDETSENEVDIKPSQSSSNESDNNLDKKRRNANTSELQRAKVKELIADPGEVNSLRFIRQPIIRR